MNTKGFYKKTNDEILYASEYVQAPSYFISLLTMDNLILPIDGWYYFDSEELANEYFNSSEYIDSIQIPTQVRNSQLRQWLIDKNLDELVEAKLSNSNNWPDVISWKKAKARYEYETMVNRNDPLVISLGHDLGLTDKQMDDAFVEIFEIP